MAITQEQAAQAKSIVSGWDADTQAKFKERYKSADPAGKEKAITNVLAKYGSQTTAAPQQPTPGPRKIGIGDVAFGLRPHIMRAVEPKIQQATAGLSQKRILPELPANTSNLLISPIGKAVYGAAQQTSSPQEFARFAMRTAADPLTYAAGPIIKATAGPVASVIGKAWNAPGKAIEPIKRFIGQPKKIGSIQKTIEAERLAVEESRAALGGFKEGIATQFKDEEVAAVKAVKDSLVGKRPELLERAQQRIKGVFAKRLEQAKNSVDSYNLTAKSALESQKGDVAKRLTGEADRLALNIKSEAPAFFRRNSEAYGKIYDPLIEKVDEAVQLRGVDVNNILVNAAEASADDTGIIAGKNAQEYAKSIMDSLKIGGDEPVSVKTLHSLIKKMNKTAYSGGRANEQTIFLENVKSNLADYLADTGDDIGVAFNKEFRALQSEYKPVIQYMNETARILNLRAGPANTKTAVAFIEANMKGTAAPSEERVFNFIQTGVPKFGKGIKVNFNNAKTMADNLKSLDEGLVKLGYRNAAEVTSIAQQEARALAELQKRGSVSKKILEARIEEAKRNVMVARAKAEMNLAKQLQALDERSLTLDARQALVDQIKADRQRVKAIALGVGGTLSVLGGLKAAKDIVGGATSKAFEAVTS